MNTVLVTEELTGGHYLFKKKGCDIVFVTALFDYYWIFTSIT